MKDHLFRRNDTMAHGRSVNKGNHCCILKFISLLAMVDRLVAKTSVAI